MGIRTCAAALLVSAAVAAGTAGAAPDAAPGTPALETAASTLADVDLPGVVGAVLPRPDPGTEAEREARTAQLGQELGDLGADVSVAVLDVDSGEEVVVGRTQVQAASTMKVDILAALLARGTVLTQRERSLSRAMITRSDNDATDALLREVGIDAVNQVQDLAGAQDTALKDDEWGTTTTTALDRLRTLRVVLGEKSVLHPRGERFARRLMSRVVDEQRIGVSAAADRPAGTPLKAGYLPRDRDDRWDVSSMGEVQADGRTYLVAVVSAGSGTLEAGARRIDAASRLAVAAVADLNTMGPAA